MAADSSSGYKQSIDLSVGGDAAWKRPALAAINPATDSVSMQLIDVDYLIADPLPIGSSATNFSQKQAVLRMFGVNDAGNSVLVYVHNFMRYFYVPAPPNATADMINMFGQSLNVSAKQADAALASPHGQICRRCWRLV